MSGNRVIITPVDTLSLSALSGESFTYKAPIETYIIYNERPKVSLLRKFGWYREDVEELPQVATIPTHLLYSKSTGEVVNEVLLEGDEFQELVQTGESENYELRGLDIKRGTLIDVFYDFAPDVKGGLDSMYDAGEFSEPQDSSIDSGEFDDIQEVSADFNEETTEFDRPVDHSTVINRFYVVDPRMDTISIAYTCKIMPYKYDSSKEAESTQNPSNGEYLKFDSDNFGS
jgi:hypothetical protein